MNSNDVASSDLIAWIEKSLEDQQFVDYQINVTGKTEKGDGYVGEIVFANVEGTTKENGRKVLDLVIKHGKKNDLLRKAMPMRSAFENEIHLYDEVFPAFRKFQLEKHVDDGFESVPRCYKTLMMDNMEVLVLDNLRKLGYELHDRKKSLNLCHLKTILKEYGKFHALSFALQQQKKEIFDSLSDYNNNLLVEFFTEKSIQESFQTTTDDAINMLKERNEVVLFNKFRNLLTKSPSGMLLNLLSQKELKTVITHGDCWNNNFMFKYENEDRTCPTKVAILDWQISSVQSPALDLSYFLYANSSKEELDRFDELMETYYASFSQFLRELGSDPDELFTFSDLKSHWKKYSLFGLLFMPMLLRFALCNKEEAPALEDLKENEDIGSMMLLEIGNKDLYYERIKAVVSHYFNYEF